MTSHRHRRNYLWVAFLAIAGTLSVGAPAKACAEVKVPKTCCEVSPAADCRCCGTSDSPAPFSGVSRSEGIEWSRSAAGLDAPRSGSSCECRSNAPAAPAQKPDSRTSEQSRTDQGHDEVIAYLAYAPRPSLPAFRLISANLSPPKSPLYLRTLHLLV
jgi:hypothetical protein